MAQVATTALQMFGQYKKGRAEKLRYNQQAAQARLQGRSNAIAYKQQAADVLRRMNENMGTVVARAAAGGVDPLSGSAQALQNYARKEGYREHNIALDNANLALGMADYQANIYRKAGRTAMTTAYIGMATTAASSFQQSQQTGFKALSLGA